MKVLADTSVWIDHLRHHNSELYTLLGQKAIGMHEFVIGELACGNLHNRDQFFGDMGLLPKTPTVPAEEALALVEMHRLHGQGLGWMDINLLASALVAGASLWTLDKGLHKAAEKLRIAF